MPKGELSFSDASALLDLVVGTLSGGIDKLFDLSKLPRKMMEIERKYRLAKTEDDVDYAISRFFSRFGKFVEDNGIVIEKLITFVGIDQYFIIKKADNEFIFRYRLGANRPPQLTVKFQVTAGSNLVRGEINLNVRYEEPDKIMAFMSVICGLGDSYQIFTVQQSGNIWIIEEPGGNLVEIVAYKTDRISPSKKIEGFVEIEPLNSKNIEQVIATIEKYEKALDLSGFVCKESIADMFRS